MKVEVLKPRSNESVIVEAQKITVRPPDNGVYVILAEVDDGDSPLLIALDNGQEVAAKRIELARLDRYNVPEHQRAGARPHTVRAHSRRLPASLGSYARYKRLHPDEWKRWRDKIAEGVRRAAAKRKAAADEKEKKGPKPPQQRALPRPTAPRPATIEEDDDNE